MTKILKGLALLVCTLALAGGMFLTNYGTNYAPAEAAIKHNTRMKNGNSGKGPSCSNLTILVNTVKGGKYSIKLRPGKSYTLYGTTKYVWVPSRTTMYRDGHLWKDASHKQGFWAGDSGFSHTYRTWC